MNSIKYALTAVFALVATGCVSSSVLVGTPRPPIHPDEVKLYVDPPARFEKIAILESNSDASWAITAQQKTNKTVQRLKTEAARHGANGVLLQNIGDRYAGSVGVGNAWASGGHAWGIGTSAATYNKAGNGIAIYVFADNEAVPANATVIAAPTTQMPSTDSETVPSPSPGVANGSTSDALPATNAAYEAALRYAAERGCSANGINQISGNVYRASCPQSGRSLVMQCQAKSCKQIN